MSEPPYVLPSFLATGFHCPRCRAYSQQTWHRMLGLELTANWQKEFDEVTVATCNHCKEKTYWVEGVLIFPRTRGAPQPNKDLDTVIQNDYEEAANIEQDSPRGAAALLRLCIQKLCRQLGEGGENINDDIASLVSKGLPLEVKHALDVVRIIGNNAVHPGQIEVADNRDTVSTLFKLVNIIAERMITNPKEIEALHSTLPASIQGAIAKRDAKALAPPRRTS